MDFETPKIYANNLTTLSLGRQGENLARQVVFDIQDLESLYGSGTVEVIYQRPGDAQPYPLAVQREGTLVTWDVSSTDTEMPGDSGKCELRYYVGEVLAKSKIWRTWVETAMDTPSETAPPEPEQGWVDQVVAVGAAAQASADAAKADADRATALAAEVSKKAAQTAQDASDAAKAMEAAQTAQHLAEEAQSAAEAARTAAETAQAAAEQSATDAAGAKQDAETAQKAAQDAAAAAAKALEDIRALYQQMQTWAQGVIQDVNAAGSAAVQSVQSAGDAQVQRVTAEGAAQTANAKAQANAAAQSASEAAQSAKEAAESAAVYDTVVADVNQLKQDVAAITPDDTTVDGKPWTSKKIVDSLCQPFEDTGNPVQCYPVENYPLGVRVSWEPVQEGSGDPSPDNIRPIKGRDSATVIRCGENLLNPEKNAYITYTPYGLTITYIGDNKVHLNGTYNHEGGSFVILDTKQKILAGRNLKITGFTIEGTKQTYTLYGLRRKDETVIAMQSNFVEGDVIDMTVAIVVSQDTPTAYTPYIGQTNTLTLPETVYGGTLDVESGVVTVCKKLKTLTGQEGYTAYTYVDAFFTTINDAVKIGNNKLVTDFACSHFPSKAFYKDGHYFQGAQDAFAQEAGNTLRVAMRKSGIETGNIDAFKSWIKAQYDAGTPVQICYKLAEPYTIQLSPQRIAALSGTNTIYTDADGVVVTGAEDPKHTITELKNAIISLGGNI